MIELTAVSKCFNAGKPNEFIAVNDVNLTIDPGVITVFNGPSGSGKTTLLALIGCMSRPTAGRIRLAGARLDDLTIPVDAAGVDISSLPERFLTAIRRRTFGFIFQQFNLIKGISVLENVLLPAVPTGEDYALSRQRALALLEQFELSRHIAAPVEWLSGGEQQRVAIARALINDPAVIIADEPTAHLDSRLSREFMSTVAILRATGKTVLIASHDPLVFDSPLVDRIVAMRDGRIVGGDTAP